MIRRLRDEHGLTVMLSSAPASARSNCSAIAWPSCIGEIWSFAATGNPASRAGRSTWTTGREPPPYWLRQEPSCTSTSDFPTPRRRHRRRHRRPRHRRGKGARRHAGEGHPGRFLPGARRLMNSSCASSPANSASFSRASARSLDSAPSSPSRSSYCSFCFAWSRCADGWRASSATRDTTPSQYLSGLHSRVHARRFHRPLPRRPLPCPRRRRCRQQGSRRRNAAHDVVPPDLPGPHSLLKGMVSIFYTFVLTAFVALTAAGVGFFNSGVGGLFVLPPSRALWSLLRFCSRPLEVSCRDPASLAQPLHCQPCLGFSLSCLNMPSRRAQS